LLTSKELLDNSSGIT